MVSDTGKAERPLPSAVILQPPLTLERQTAEGRATVGSSSSAVLEGWQEAEVIIIRRQRSRLDRPKIADLDADSAGNDQGLFKLAARLTGFEIDNESLSCARTCGKLGLSPADGLAFLADGGAEIPC
jgi:hypothetical protein